MGTINALGLEAKDITQGGESARHMNGTNLRSSFLISKTPYRISFFGGGTDYPVWYNENPGAVLATSIDKYCYILCRWMPPFFEHKYRIAWSQIETPQEIEEIRHPSVRETLKFMEVTNGVEIHHAGDLPAMTGVGTSSAFTVGLLNALHSLQGEKVTKMQLAVDAIHVEQDMIKENVGSQDQVTAACGGFNWIDFASDGIKVSPVRSKRLKELEGCLMLFFTGLSRTASQIAREQIEKTRDNKSILMEMYAMVDEGVKILTGNGRLSAFGKLLGESWHLKQCLSNRISTDYINHLFTNAISAGATGGKLLGAGGGGFLLFFVEPDLQAGVKKRRGSLLHVPFKFESEGSKVIFDD